jgi:serine phosphatase RsbU (regulator of sigma subunit)
MIKYSISLACAFVFLTHSLLAQNELDSLVKKLETIGEIEKIDLLNKLSESFREKDLDKSIGYADEAILLAEKNKKSDKLAISQINKGVAFRSKGDSKPALEYFLKALVIAEQINDLNIQADALHKIGVTYLFQKDFYSALKFAEKEEIIWREIKDDKGIAAAANFLGLIYVNLKDYDRALKELEESLEIARKTKDNDLIYKPLTNLGDLYIRLKNVPKAIDYISQSLKVSEESNNKFGIASSLLNLGKAYKLKKDNKTAIEYVKKSLDKSIEIQTLSLIRNSYEVLTELYEETGDFQKSLFFHKLYKFADDSLINKNVRQSMNEMELKYEAQKKEQEVVALRMEKELFDKERDLNWAIRGGLSLITLLALIATFLYYRQSRLKQQTNNQLVGINKTITQKSEEVNEQKEIIEQINKNLVSSINYAKNIQDVLLPKKADVLNAFSGYFVFNSPRDIVSGDFNWFGEVDGQTIIAIGDCTGHGVPAALITVLCHSFLHEICEQTTSPARMLEKMNEKVMAQLHHKEGLSNDGVELAICIISADKTQLIYAGAKLPLYLVQNQEFKIIKGNNFPIGDAHYSAQRAYSEHIISIVQGDMIYLASDGYQDQFGGESNRKFMVKNFRTLLTNISTEDIESQAKILENNILAWRGQYKQTDDVMVFGLKI